MSTTPNAVEQKRKTTVAAETIPGLRAGSVTVRRTCHGDAPSAAAASSRRRSRLSQSPPTVRTTTARLKKIIAARMATALPSRPRKPSVPAGASRVRNATPTTTVGSTKGITTSARSAWRPGKCSLYNTYASGRPSPTVTAVAVSDAQAVNQSTRCTRGRDSVSARTERSSDPSTQNPCASMPVSGSRKKTPRNATGTTARAMAPSRAPRRALTGW